MGAPGQLLIAGAHIWENQSVAYQQALGESSNEGISHDLQPAKPAFLLGVRRFLSFKNSKHF